MSDSATVFVVDDDPALRESLELLARSAGLPAKSYPTAAEFLRAYDANQAGCVLADIRMPGMSGLELQEVLAEKGMPIPVIILTGHADVSAAVRAMKHGAVDFVEKPFEPDALVAAIEQAIGKDRAARATARRDSEVAGRIASLTPREREVMDMVTAGKANKVIAFELSISERTVELHRSRIMKKMGVHSAAELVRLVLPREGLPVSDEEG